MKRLNKLNILIVAVIAVVLFFAGSYSTESKVEKYPPHVNPERIVLTWNNAVHNSQAVTWRTSVDVKSGMVQWVKAVNSADEILDPTQKKAITKTFKSDVNEANYHCATMTDLLPETNYMYRVGDGKNWSEWFQFTTAKSEADDFSFLYFGDLQNGIKQHCSRVIRNAYTSCTDAAFMLFGGDLVNDPEDNQWGEWFESGDWIYASVPVMAAAGNHEYKRQLIGGLGEHWKYQFNFPTNGPEGLQASVYYFDYQGVRFVVLDTEGMSDGIMGSYEKQRDWLEETLANNPYKWSVVTLHHPFLSNRKGRNNDELKNLVKPVFDKYDVDLVLQGHDHTYGRTGFLTETENKGPVYVTSVAGSKMYVAEPKEEMQRMASSTQLYQKVDVKENSILFSTYTVNGNLYDQFILQKDEKGNKELIELIPEGQDERLNLPRAYKENRSEKELQEYQIKLDNRKNNLQANT
ncbi:fibronectin type III domain-containing protein [Marinifilum sp.]|uniref:fibronectin type III domain-containing protein n=1 Tax=Marinifilum sp. TaxID=2033137 RepID=UPI003BAD8E08